eukprot:313221-Pleurochrysis_carterae.AAC.1
MYYGRKPGSPPQEPNSNEKTLKGGSLDEPKSKAVRQGLKAERNTGRANALPLLTYLILRKVPVIRSVSTT